LLPLLPEGVVEMADDLTLTVSFACLKKSWLGVSKVGELGVV